MLSAVIGLLVYALIVLLVVLLIEWVAKMFGVPGNILMVIRVIVALIFLAYLINFLIGSGPAPPPLFR